MSVDIEELNNFWDELSELIFDDRYEISVHLKSGESFEVCEIGRIFDTAAYGYFIEGWFHPVDFPSKFSHKEFASFDKENMILELADGTELEFVVNINNGSGEEE
jgi:hypothetical protein